MAEKSKHNVMLIINKLYVTLMLLLFDCFRTVITLFLKET